MSGVRPGWPAAFLLQFDTTEVESAEPMWSCFFAAQSPQRATFFFRVPALAFMITGTS